ncbi:protein FAM161A [Microcaecilia unicolor]|uniref:Protein FAM161A n=1 Tax=Microcaecilia unicolor TaxID=1415580 RepID=A0A6P7XFR0_9AMPH|nr:protein FAM161A [Microcaecilia unicolor]XP_030052029.1 protein FAM161A [Microcaecilia unicolor]XP_030052030.1 protein FAM161A [Microcaecilia unicolor]XP_030052031.1 protein FAM161A [Microcaecilia unicolor]XP_030052032.1 protein FAM161A [Microcaecilia unicolor]XP_030052033.1 protein FAM161A [Microcaecilia unicolor]
MNSESDSESEHSLYEKKNRDGEDCIDFSKMWCSNREYYMQLEKLKNAHIKAMAQLEKMYQNKLHLKGVLPLEKKENIGSEVYRSASEKSVLEQAASPKSTTESAVNSPVSSGLSNGHSDESTDEENGSKDGVLTSAQLQILKMWHGFSVDDYTQRSWHDFPRSSKLKDKKKAKNWSKKVTVPEPFQMTIREAKKKQQKVKSKSEIELENSLLKKLLEEETECQKQFRANPVPASVFFPLYREIMERNEERRKFVKDRSKEILLASQKPFQFIEREERKKKMKKLQLEDLVAPKLKTHTFKAKPVPKSVYSPAISERLQENNLYRAIRIQMRAQELLQSSVPPSMLTSHCPSGERKSKCCEPKEELYRKPQINLQVPDFEVLHRKFQKQLLQKKDAKQVTVCEPFYLHTLGIPSRKEKILRDIQTDEDKLKETRWPYTTPRRKPQIRCSNISTSPWSVLETEPPRTTESTKRRQQAVSFQDESDHGVESENEEKYSKDYGNDKVNLEIGSIDDETS